MSRMCGNASFMFPLTTYIRLGGSFGALFCNRDPIISISRLKILCASIGNSTSNLVKQVSNGIQEARFLDLTASSHNPHGT